MNKRIIFIDWVKVGAIVLIINSHLDNIYPISVLATGGAVGNALFFIASGYLLFPATTGFISWFWHRISKIYPYVWVHTIFMLIIGFKKLSWSPVSVFEVFIWPTHYWFIGAIIIFYVFSYFITKNRCLKYILLSQCILVVISGLYYVFLLDTGTFVIEEAGLNSIAGFYKLFYYFFIMLSGAVLKLVDLKLSPNKCLFMSVSSFGLLYLVKALLQTGSIPMEFQFLNQIFVVLFAWFTMVFFMQLDLMKFEKINIGMRVFASRSLAVYLVQFWMIDWCSCLYFPLNLFCCLAGILIVSEILYRLCDTMIKIMRF